MYLFRFLYMRNGLSYFVQTSSAYHDSIEFFMRTFRILLEKDYKRSYSHFDKDR